ncbi:MAG: M23 family metallopeptidase [Syntrophaceae bacterium]
MAGKRKFLFLIIAYAIIILLSPDYIFSAVGGYSTQFELPIKCTLGRDCFIMHYIDLDPGDAEIDYGCGRQTYNKHDGIDFGISDIEVMNRGIPVIASAGGVVMKVRDGVVDRLVQDQKQKDNVKKVECGNGLIVDHGNGWQSQYCHMRNHSITVKKGDQVEKGTVLGMVGASGLASFPHVHFTVRYQGKVVDPFIGITTASGCKVERHPIWDKTPDYVPTGLIRAGFAPKPPSQTQLWQGEFTSKKSKLSDMHAIIFWVHLYGVLRGDKEHFTLIAPDNRVMIDNEKLLKKNYRSWFSYSGKKTRRKNEYPRAFGVVFIN